VNLANRRLGKGRKPNKRLSATACFSHPNLVFALLGFSSRCLLNALT
jgi:hypothetical protein